MPKLKFAAAKQRARQMMLGGMVFGHVAGVIVMALGFAVSGFNAFLSAGIAFLAAVVFYTVGQWMEVVATNMEPKQAMKLVLASYVVRVVGITAGLWWALSIPSIGSRVEGGWLVASITATVFAWVAGVVVVASRQQVPVYDLE